MARVAVIGAGIAGLSAAHCLEQSGRKPVVYEARRRIGGMIRSELESGFLVEHGPNSIQSAGEVLDELIDRVGLRNERVEASAAARMRYIVRDGRPTPVPTSPARLFTADLFGAGSKLRVLREPFVRPGDPAAEESVAQFIRRRLGPEILDFGVEPFVAGVYAGDAELLSLRYAFPTLFEMEQNYGSIIRGQFDSRRGAAAEAETHRMFSFQAGLGRLPEALAATVPEIRLDSAVRKIERDNGGWSVHVKGFAPEHFEAVVFAAPLHALAELEHPSGLDLRPLTSVRYAPLAVVALGFRREDVDHPLDGFGMLVPRVERGFRILGTLFTSSIFGRRAPDGQVLLTSFIGGMRRPELAGAPTTEAVDVVLRDLRRLLGTGSPTFRKHVVWTHSIPQYHVGYGKALETMDRLEQAWPGWFLAGNYRGGVSVSATVTSGADAARRCTDYLDG